MLCRCGHTSTAGAGTVDGRGDAWLDHVSAACWHEQGGLRLKFNGIQSIICRPFTTPHHTTPHHSHPCSSSHRPPITRNRRRGLASSSAHRRQARPPDRTAHVTSLTSCRHRRQREPRTHRKSSTNHPRRRVAGRLPFMTRPRHHGECCAHPSIR